jgi:thiamine-phosphate pyrophosphorylase
VRPLTDALLYGIIDLGYVDGQDAARILEQLIGGGIDLVQLRGKNRGIEDLTALAEDLLPITRLASMPLVANDYAAVAQRVQIQGVHVGQDDETIDDVRARVARPIIVGKSTHSVAQAVAAEREGADYIGFGPIFSTPTKPDYPPIGFEQIREVHQRVSIPIFCIGGIKLENLADVIAAGAKRVVIVSGLLLARDPAAYARQAKQFLGNIAEPSTCKHRIAEIQ